MKREITISVDGMTCRHCVRAVTARLRDVPGVETVVADVGSSSIRLGGTMTLPDILTAFRDLAYRPRVVEPPQAAVEA